MNSVRSLGCILSSPEYCVYSSHKNLLLFGNRPMWDFWWTEWQWDRCFFEHVYFPSTFMWPCIVINFLKWNQLDALISPILFLEWNSTCFGQFLCPSAGVFHCTHYNGICHTSFLAAWYCCVCSEKLPMMDRGTVRNMWSFISKINVRN